MFILWYSASSTFGKDSDIVMGVRAQQKEKTRRSLVEAAFSQLSAERSFASLSLREVAREAGIAYLISGIGLGRLISILFFGVISDKFGRRAVILMSVENFSARDDIFWASVITLMPCRK